MSTIHVNDDVLPPTPEVLQSPNVTSNDEQNYSLYNDNTTGYSTSDDSSDDWSWLSPSPIQLLPSSSPTVLQMEKSIQLITVTDSTPVSNIQDESKTPILQWCFNTPIHHSPTPPQLTTTINNPSNI